MATLHLRATSFATPQDIKAYNKCRAAGHSDDYCTSSKDGGDSGKGAWGDDTTTKTVAYCALPRKISKKHQSVHVALFTKGRPLGKPFDCIQGDIGPVGVIDLNPGALAAAGLNPAMDLDASAEVTIGGGGVAKAATMAGKLPVKVAAKKSAAGKKPR